MQFIYLSSFPFQGSFINHVNRFLDIYDPLPLSGQFYLIRLMYYVVIWPFGKPPPLAVSTWFMNAPLRIIEYVHSTPCVNNIRRSS